ncbi:MAG TPA: T9SS type A sorting domain-containing protein [Bacteroidales bacterium]|nr:T9SS type A sorting domain-containing protein [Bacteroidales bacterium]
MKRKNLLVLFFMLIGMSSFSQTATLQTVTGATPGAVSVDLTLTGCPLEVSAFQMTIVYDTNVLVYNIASPSSGVTDWFSGVSGVGIQCPGGKKGRITFVWGDLPQPVNGVLCKLNFTYVGPGCSYVNFSNSPTPLLVADGTPNYDPYTVTWVNGQVCDVLTGIDDNKVSDAVVEIYPTVTNDKINIKYNVPENGNVTFGLYNMVGDEIQSITKECTGNTEAIQEMNVSNLNSGLYFIKYQIETASSTTVKTEKITIAR